jgi:hypothetical protein
VAIRRRCNANCCNSYTWTVGAPSPLVPPAECRAVMDRRCDRAGAKGHSGPVERTMLVRHSRGRPVFPGLFLTGCRNATTPTICDIRVDDRYRRFVIPLSSALSIASMSNGYRLTILAMSPRTEDPTPHSTLPTSPVLEPRGGAGLKYRTPLLDLRIASSRQRIARTIARHGGEV